MSSDKVLPVLGANSAEPTNTTTGTADEADADTMQRHAICTAIGVATVTDSSAKVGGDANNQARVQEGERPVRYFDVISDDNLLTILEYFVGNSMGLRKIACTSKRMAALVEDTCRHALPRIISVEKAALTAYPEGISFQAYTTFLDTLTHPLGTFQGLPVVVEGRVISDYQDNRWMGRYTLASTLRPRREGGLGNVAEPSKRDRFDYGYPGGFYADMYGTGQPNDYLRRVGNSPPWYALAAAGSDSGQYYRLSDQEAVAVREERKTEDAHSSYLQTMSRNTEYDNHFTMWIAFRAVSQQLPPPSGQP